MAEKIKVINRCKYNYGVITPNRMHINIAPGSFVFLTEDDIQYIESVAAPHKKPFATGKLVVEKSDVLEQIGVQIDEVNFLLSDEEIDKKLRAPINVLKKWLDGVEDKSMLANIAVRAKEADLPSSKLKAIAEKVPNADLFD